MIRPLRVFLACQQDIPNAPVHPVPAYRFWLDYFASALREAGHTLLSPANVDWAKGLLPLSPSERTAWLEHTWSRTVDYIQRENRRAPIDFALFYLFPDQVLPGALSELRSIGVPTVNFFCDNVREFTSVPTAFVGFDLHWVPEFEALSLYARAGLPHLHAPMPMWVSPDLRTPPRKETDDITFIGSHDPLREDLLARAVQRGLVLRLHGAGWKSIFPSTLPASPRRHNPLRTVANQVSFVRRYGLVGLYYRTTYQLRARQNPGWIERHWQPLAPDAYALITRESCVTLGINRYPGFRHTFDRPGCYSRLRDIEAPMLGACYLTEYAPGLEQLYDLENEILTYQTIDGLLAQIERLRGDHDLRRQLRTAGQRRALVEHSLPRSLQRIAAKLGVAG